MFKSVKEIQKEIYDAMKTEFGYKNRMQLPKIQKVIISSGVGSTSDKNKAKLVGEKLALIAGQKPSTQLAKKSIAGFKVREGQLSGYRSTLRGEMATNFVDKLIHIALPRTKDFRGLSIGSADEMGNYTLGIKENTIFPETSDQDIKDIFGLSVTIVTSAKNKKEVISFLEKIGMPFKK
jgi:large subunit ribosomal protein L5